MAEQAGGDLDGNDQDGNGPGGRPDTAHQAHVSVVRLPNGTGASFADIALVATDAERAGATAVVAGPATAGGFEPFTLLGALSAVTSSIGLVAAVDPLTDPPYTVARKAVSLDHLSGGRAGVLVPSGSAVADEFTTVLHALWSAESADAFPRDRASGVYAREDGRPAIDHVGAHFRVAGPLNISRAAQGSPVVYRGGEIGPVWEDRA